MGDSLEVRARRQAETLRNQFGPNAATAVVIDELLVELGRFRGGADGRIAALEQECAALRDVLDANTTTVAAASAIVGKVEVMVHQWGEMIASFVEAQPKGVSDA